jgi:nucleotide-binding universal stress UspA family protein
MTAAPELGLNGHHKVAAGPTDLLPQHASLVKASGISPEVAAARGYRSAHSKAELEALEFAPSQRRVPALVIPVRNTQGRIAFCQIRPDDPRQRQGKAVKYETPSGARMVLDVPPGARARLGDPAEPLWITEGVRKADAAVSAGVCCTALIGVWNWRGSNAQGGKTALPDWEDVHLKGRQVLIAFDSDVMTKRAVAKALERLEAFLGSRGAHVKRVYLPAGADGSKVGLDDYLAAGGTLDELLKQPGPEPAPAASGDSRGPTQGTQLVALADAAGVEVFHTPAGEAWATVPVAGHREHWPLSARGTGGFKRWLRGRVYADKGSGVSEQHLQEAIATLESRAHYEGRQRSVFTRLGEHEGAIYLDLGDPDWNAVEIRPGGWRVVAEPPVKFRRGRGLQPLPTPVAGGSLDELRPLVNVADEDDWTRLVGWLVGTLNPRPSYAVLCLHGEQGSAKSSTARILRALVDPGFPALRSAPDSERDLMIAAAGTWCLTLDNLSGIKPWLSDALCRLADGAGWATRELHSDSDEVLFEAARPVLMTGIEELTTRPDLVSRAMLLALPSIAPTAVRTKRELETAFAAIQPRVLGGLLDAAACALARRDDPAVRPPSLPRMADLIVWVTAAEPALGWPAGRFLAAYASSQQAGHVVALESAEIGPTLLALADEGFDGTCTDALARLNALAGDRAGGRGWPTNAQSLSGMIRRLEPALRAAGFEVIRGSKGRGSSKRNGITFRGSTSGCGPIGPIGPTPDQTPAQSQIDGVANEPPGGATPEVGPQGSRHTTDIAAARGAATPTGGAAVGPQARQRGNRAVMRDGADGADGAASTPLGEEKDVETPQRDADRAELERAERLLADYDGEGRAT